MRCGRLLYWLGFRPALCKCQVEQSKILCKSKFSKENHPKSDPDCALSIHSKSNQHNKRSIYNTVSKEAVSRSKSAAQRAERISP